MFDLILCAQFGYIDKNILIDENTYLSAILCSLPNPGGTLRLEPLMYEIIILFKSALSLLWLFGLLLLFKKYSCDKNVIGGHIHLRSSIKHQDLLTYSNTPSSLPTHPEAVDSHCWIS